MKKILLFAATIMMVSCSAKDLLKPDPEVTEKGVVSLQASLGADHVWSGSDAIGVYGTKMGSNAKYVISTSFLGKTGTVTMYGAAVDGELVAYYPYTPKGMASMTEGCVILPAIQTYCKEAGAQITSNTFAFARAVEGVFDMDYKVGVVHFNVTAKFSGEVKSVTLSSMYDVLSGAMSIDDGSMDESGAKSVSVRGIGKPEGEFDVWVMLPCGSYTGLEMTIVSDEGSVTKSVRGSIPVADGQVSETILKDEAFEYAGSEYIVIRGEFD